MDNQNINEIIFKEVNKINPDLNKIREIMV